MYTFSINLDTRMCTIFSDGVPIDVSGPWESEASAYGWADAYTNKLNLGIVVPEQPS